MIVAGLDRLASDWGINAAEPADSGPSAAENVTPARTPEFQLSMIIN
jgi:hypothetical protein